MTTIESIVTDMTHPRIARRVRAVEASKNRRRHIRLYTLAAVIVVLVLSFASLYSPLFDVDEIQVTGATLRTKEEYIAATGLELSTPLIKLDHEQVVEKLEALPEVQAATSSSKWDGSVSLNIYERVAVARFVSHGISIVTASDGTVLAVGEEINTTLPVIKGVMLEREVGELVPERSREGLALAAALPSDLAKLVDQVSLTVDTLELDLLGGASVSFGDTRDLSDKFDALRAVVNQVEMRCVRNINITAPAAPVITERPGC